MTIVQPVAAWESSETHQTVFVDCRFSLGDTEAGHSEYLDGHVPGAVYADLNTDLSSEVVAGVTGRHPMPREERFVSFVERSGISSNTQVFLYDDAGGPFAARAWWLFRYFGHERVAVIDGGWGAWRRDDLPVASGEESNAPGMFSARVQESMLTDVSEIEKNTGSGKILVDARSNARYCGIDEPIDPVAGHIPGALSYQYADNLRPDKTFKSPSELKERFSGLDIDRPIISYCGSGVTGAHNVLAMTIAGLPMPSLYVGSWSEWITDPDRPIEV